MLPAVVDKAERVASVEAALVTFTVYVLVVLPSCAVTTISIGLLPTVNVIAPEAEPLVTVTLFTVTVAFAWFTVGVTVMLVVAFATLAV